MPAVANPAIEAKYGPVVAVVASDSEPGKSHEVRHALDGSFSCQCMGYRFNRFCKHIFATQVDMGVAVTQVGKKPVAAPKVKPSTSAAVPQRPQPHEQPSITAAIQAEAAAVAQSVGSLLVGHAVKRRELTDRVEAAIRKFMAAPAVADVPRPVMAASGVRMIILDE